jgi:hypothetical protein
METPWCSGHGERSNLFMRWGDCFAGISALSRLNPPRNDNLYFVFHYSHLTKKRLSHLASDSRTISEIFPRQRSGLPAVNNLNVVIQRLPRRDQYPAAVAGKSIQPACN